ncbi:4-coumarate--CoA ligase-like 4 [Hibiscus syriacus]|uniref:4-coumarate--CoA ligase-like 4 n=1 Tax=Hibiscus syriacus TaxID=106335 RepID=A0A6A3BNC2_HIBSY|nr:4-coumarate--CoA ligase-like 4 [Hibiscus syriacus]
MAEIRSFTMDPRSGFCWSNSTFYSKRNPIPLPKNDSLDVTTFISARAHHGQIAFIDAATGRHLTFTELWRAVDSVATCLSDMGIRKGHVPVIAFTITPLLPKLAGSTIPIVLLDDHREQQHDGSEDRHDFRSDDEDGTEWESSQGPSQPRRHGDFALFVWYKHDMLLTIENTGLPPSGAANSGGNGERRRSDTEEVRSELVAFGFVWVRLTESTGIGASTDSLEESRRYGTAGMLSPSMEAKVVDPESGKALMVNQTGELWLKGPSVMKGPPAELEALLLTHPEILDAAVIPFPDKEVGQFPMAYVVRKPGSDISETQVMEFVGRQVAPYKRIRKVAFVASIPKNPSGKILGRI